MNLIKIGNLVGQLQGIISSIDCGTLNTKKNNTNEYIKIQATKLLKELEEELSNK